MVYRIYYHQKMTAILYVATIKTWESEKLNVISSVVNKNLNLHYGIETKKKTLKCAAVVLIGCNENNIFYHSSTFINI